MTYFRAAMICQHLSKADNVHWRVFGHDERKFFQDKIFIQSGSLGTDWVQGQRDR